MEFNSSTQKLIAAFNGLSQLVVSGYANVATLAGVMQLIKEEIDFPIGAPPDTLAE